MRQTESKAPNDDPLQRIQKEISEVEKREMEFRNEHANITTIEKCKLAIQSPPMSPTNSDKINDDQQSDDSGFIVSSDVAKHYDMKNNFSKNKIVEPKVQPRSTPLVLTRAVSTPQLFQNSPARKFNFAPAQKGIMERFISSRGKLVTSQQNGFQNNLVSPIDYGQNKAPFLTPPSKIALDTLQRSPAAIERDEKGKPIRRGFVPVEEKIQKELRDLRNRETELKMIRKQKFGGSKTNLLDYDESYESNEDELKDHGVVDDDYRSYDEYDNYPPMNGKLRASRSIDVLNNNSSFSPRETPSPQFEKLNNRYNAKIQNKIVTSPSPQLRSGSGMKPAVSLAQLVDDLDPKEAPSSHKLIERWETLIQEKQRKNKSSNIH
jgi:hypothetical protein